MIKFYLKILHLISILLATAWTFYEQDWEPIITLIGLLSSFIYLQYKNYLSSENNKADIELFEKFKEELPYDCISFLTAYSLQTSYHKNKLDPLFNFISHWNNVHHTFLDKKLNKLKNSLFDKVDKFTDLVSEYVYEAENTGLNRIPKEWSYQKPEEYREICRKIDTAQDSVINRNF